MEKRRKIPLGRYFWGLVLKLPIWLLLRVEVRGEEKLPRTGAGIVYYNHIHWLDPVLISSKLQRYNVPLTKIEASRWPLVGLLLRWYHVIFIRRGEVDREALKATWQVLADGDISVISPEGTRSYDGRLRTAREGLAFVARQAPQAWLIPCAVTGTSQFKWHFPLVNRPHVVLTFGRPCSVRWPQGKIGRETLRAMTGEAMAQLAALLPPESRGDYAGSDPDTVHWLEFLP